MSTAPWQPVPPQLPKRRRGDVIVLAVLLIAALIAGLMLWWFLSLSDKPAKKPSGTTSTATSTSTTSSPITTTSTHEVTTTRTETVTVPVAVPTPTLELPRKPDSSIAQQNTVGSSYITSAPPGTSIIVVASLPKSDISRGSALVQASELTTNSALPFQVVDSDTVGGLNPGYYAISAFVPAGATAESTCAMVGRPLGGTCYGRIIGG
ncbi:MAG: hypothetical protein ACRCWS_08610 [Propionibacteriaceae bacterium]